MSERGSTEAETWDCAGPRRRGDFMAAANDDRPGPEGLGVPIERAVTDAQAAFVKGDFPTSTSADVDQADRLKVLLTGIIRHLGQTAASTEDRFSGEQTKAWEQVVRSFAKDSVDPQWSLVAQGIYFEQAVSQALAAHWPRALFPRSTAAQASIDAAREAILSIAVSLLQNTDVLWTGHLQESQTVLRQADAAEHARHCELVNDAFGQAFQKMLVGDFSARIDGSIPAEHRDLAARFNVAMERVQSTFAEFAGRLIESHRQAGPLAEELASIAEQSQSGSERLRSAADRLSDLVADARSAATEADAARETVDGARQCAVEGGRVMDEAVTAMTGIEGSADRIGQITAAIDDIAFQTNLLAFNAGIEATRVGEAGCGFAVVAQEMRALAQRSADAAKEIGDVVSQVTRINDVVTGLAERSGRQADDVGELHQSIASIYTGFVALSESAQRSGEAAGDIHRVIVELDGIVRCHRADLTGRTARPADAGEGDEGRMVNGAADAEQDWWRLRA